MLVSFPLLTMQLRGAPLCTQEGNDALGGPPTVTPGTAWLANEGELQVGS